MASISSFTDSARDMFGERMMLGTSEPSCSSGTKAVPSSGKSDQLPTSSATAMARVQPPWRRAVVSSRR
jgi:hypothetical protein